MMKKMTKAALLAAALAFTAGLAGCFVSAVEDDGPEVRTVTLDELKLGASTLTDVAAKDPAIVSVEAGGSAKAVAAARAAAAITSFTITPKKQGSTHIILTVTGGDTDTLYLPVTVSSDLKLTLGTVTDKEPAEGGGTTNPNAATISFNANEDSPFVKPTVEGVFSNVKEEFGAYSIGSFWTIFTSTDQSIKAAKFSYKSADTAKLADYELLTGNDAGKVNMKGWLLTCSSSDETDGLTASEKGTEIASTTYTFTLVKRAEVSAFQVAFNGQSNDVNGQISILDSSGTVKATATGTSATKEDNDAAITDTVSLDAGTYTLKFAWVTSKDSAKIKKWNCGVEKFTLTATPAE